jgi:hypothetical protein
MTDIDLATLKGVWNEVLDLLLDVDRITWLAFFDARLVALEGNELRINFSDSEKFGGDHNYKSRRMPEQTAKLVSAISKVCGITLEVIEV